MNVDTRAANEPVWDKLVVPGLVGAHAKPASVPPETLIRCGGNVLAGMHPLNFAPQCGFESEAAPGL